MKIEIGKSYRACNGQKVGPMFNRPQCHDHFIEKQGDGRVWYENGIGQNKAEGCNLIDEWTDAPDLTAPDYNDGKWHGWNGGKCPVDPDAEVEPIWIDGRTARNRMAFRAEVISWGGCFDVPIAFRVTKPAPPKPREWWIKPGVHGRAWITDKEPEKPHVFIRVTEVLK